MIVYIYQYIEMKTIGELIDSNYFNSLPTKIFHLDNNMQLLSLSIIYLLELINRIFVLKIHF